MKYVMELLRSYDILGQRPQLFINQTDQYQKEFGGLITIMVIIAGALSSYFFGEELWLKQFPTVNQSKSYNPSPSPLVMDFDEFDMFIRLQNPKGQGYIDPTVYSVRGFVNIQYNNGSYLSTEIDMIPCTNSTFTPENLELFFPYNFTDTWCISREQTKIKKEELRLQGSYGQIDFHMLILRFYACQNTTKEKKCASPEKIQSLLSNTYLSFSTLDNYIQTSNFSYPTTKAVKNYFWSVSKDFYSSTTLFYDITTITSDAGLMFEANQEFITYTATPIINNINLVVTDGRFASLGLQLSNVKNQYYRNYMKLQDVFAQVGGIFQFIQIFTWMIYTYYNDHYYFQELFNSLFSYKPFEKQTDESIKYNDLSSFG
jgi:hypothetical protein